MITRRFSLIARWAILGCAGIFVSTPAHAETHTFTWPIELTVLEGCAISATPMSFGLITGQVNRPTTTAQISLLCNPNINYEISIDNGLNANGNTRRMRNPDNGRHLRYRIYSNAGLTQRHHLHDALGNFFNRIWIADILLQNNKLIAIKPCD